MLDSMPGTPIACRLTLAQAAAAKAAARALLGMDEDAVEEADDGDADVAMADAAHAAEGAAEGTVAAGRASPVDVAAANVKEDSGADVDDADSSDDSDNSQSGAGSEAKGGKGAEGAKGGSEHGTKEKPKGRGAALESSSEEEDVKVRCAARCRSLRGVCDSTMRRDCVHSIWRLQLLPAALFVLVKLGCPASAGVCEQTFAPSY